uniref:Uncharacterized protein n=1 Tax=Acrobeloides nanus TaxID=290746 RepID=A0A914C8N1_9BILA
MGNKTSQGTAVGHAMKRESRDSTGGHLGHEHDRSQGTSRTDEVKIEVLKSGENDLHIEKNEEDHLENYVEPLSILSGPHPIHMKPY